MEKKIALSIEQMKHLESLGLDTSNASMCYAAEVTSKGDYIWNTLVQNRNYNKDISAYILQDILDVIERDKTVRYILSATDIEIYLMGTATKIYTSFTGNNPLNYVYNALVWCIENGYIKTNKV